MKTLKEELQEIVDEKKLTKEQEYICIFLNDENPDLLARFKDMAKNYASEYWRGSYSWWQIESSTLDDKLDYVISEKYRFIKDLIKIL